ncbi:FtsK/SpoIIIE family protein [Singulisphaera sp. GP187]|uniref:FtsK/SpoIIIE domain-containing protein n=1 Tax=Singulisphaera sp. GP187 TaxID=1882752 RepID=UPI000927933D|nr:FtsK/SpoIIIE domain-containing protein [Singulisphaera sp. GP187]SIO05671.1 FtsK/SpoIIIE family protein [Singulisphaera sp. GP187]
MPHSSLVEREVEALRTLERIAAERARRELETEQGHKNQVEIEEHAFQKALEKVTKAAKSEIEATEIRYQSVRNELRTRFETERKEVEAEFAAVRNKTAAWYRSATKAAKREYEETRWQVLAVFEAAKDSAVKLHKERAAELNAELGLLQTIKDEAEHPLESCRSFFPRADATSGEVVVPPAENPLPELQERLKRAEEQLVPLMKLTLPKFLKLQQFVWPFLILGFAAAYPLGVTLGWATGLAVDAGAVIAIAVTFWFWLATVARRQVGRFYPPFRQTLDEAEAFALQAQSWVNAAFERHKAEVEARREHDTVAADEKFAKFTAESEQRRERETREAEEKYPPLLKDIEARHAETRQQADERYPRRLADLKERLERDTAQLQENHRVEKESTQAAYVNAWKQLVDRWKAGLAEVQATVAEVNEVCNQLFLDWHQVDPTGWEPPKAVPPALRFGEFEFDLAQIPQGLSSDPRLKPDGPTRFSLPALLPFPVEGSILLKVHDSGKAEAARVLQAMMLRYLTSLPAGKVRFTIIDPVGLGENYAAFMHLGDYHELLVNSRIWTETPHIEQRLADLQAHMENVIQKYLRNEFKTIEEYNVHAGEVAEPFRVLVVANFPANFNESAARRLMSIASSGARCGVYTLISVDIKQALPSGCQLKDLESLCMNLNWREGRLQWKDPEFAKFPLKLDAPPDPETFTKLLHVVGDRARDANRVEVPFEFIAPSPEEYWTSSSAKGIDVPLGRAGATKLQHLRLGRGTSQHVLIAGKTGSGKSTLLHALITNAALRYSPDELELYLIDFKKGVEFKVYATLQLPHARVIAVESEREFGLSVLQRLDGELKLRGDQFRDLGVQDLNGYRQVAGQPPLPRILFIVDEFQEFFVEDDKIAQDTALLLDRLVRQGRAFGIHVHLGSQTLGGAFSLARSTLGQMAVRIALQCSESDAHLILSDDNSAARLLTRPGEAIYNDANGMVEGNNFFQVVWLPDERREEYLKTIKKLADDQNRPPAAQIVFEGNLPAVAAQNHLLGRLLQAPAWPEPPKADFAWLGDAIAIKDPTAAVFRPQSGSNLLIVGQNDAAALGMISTAMISLAAQHAPADGDGGGGQGVQFYLFDGTPADSRNAGLLGRLDGVFPHAVRDVAWRDMSAVIGELAAEVERRQKEAGEAPGLYLIVNDLQRFRDLRKGEDDFGFSRYGEEKATPPSKLFVNILRDGPPVGVHTIVWCDSLNNLNRTFDRQSLREFEVRVLFQMSANDSSTLIDSPAAGKLGAHRALFFSEEEGRLEKFRPYGLPTDDWLATIRRQLHGRQLPVETNSHPTHEFTSESTETAEA